MTTTVLLLNPFLQKATSHLARSMHYKNQTNFEVLFKLPDNSTDNVSTNSLIAIAFNKPLRKEIWQLL